MDRRTFLVGATASAAAIAVPVRALAASRANPALLPFVHGVASGDPLADRVVLWTRITGRTAAVPVRWVVATDPQLRQVVRSGQATASSQRDHTVKVDVDGLRPASTYWYAFEALGRRSMIGRTRTAPTASQRLRSRW